MQADPRSRAQPAGPSVAEHLSQLYETLTTTERKSARVLLDNYPVAGLETVAQFAARAGVSGPTVLRLIGKLGFAGYADFQAALRDELEARLQSPLEKHRRHREGEPGDDVERFCAALCDNIRLSLHNIPRSELEHTCQQLGDTRRQVFLIGGRFSDSLARYFYMHLHAMRSGVRHVDPQVGAWPDYLVDIRRRDLLLVFDIRRYQQDLLRFAEHATRRGAHLILFTDQWLSPIARLARHVFPVRVQAPSSWDSSAATLALIELLLMQLGEANWSQVKARMESLEEMRRDLSRRDEE